MLSRLAQQLDAIDEASLMALWNKYANATVRFEPTKRWEEATLIFALIQAKHWKNQLFNFYLSKMQKPSDETLRENSVENDPRSMNLGFSLEIPRKEESTKRSCHVLSFRARSESPEKRSSTDTSKDNPEDKE